MRLLGLPVPEKTQLVRMMQGLGQTPFDPPNVKGWAGGESWITTYTLLLRQQFLRRIVEATTVAPLDGTGMATARPDRRPDRRAHGDPASNGRLRWPSRGRSRAGACARPAARRGWDRPWRASIPPSAADAAAVAAPDRAGSRPARATVATALLDTAYQLK